jgi:type II secretion system protein N
MNLATLRQRLPSPGPRARRVLVIAGYVLAGLLSFAYALHLTFPYERVKDRAVDALASKYDVVVGGVERGWLPGSFALTMVQLRTRPENPGDPSRLIVIDRLEIDVGLLSAISGSVAVDLDARLGPGRIQGTVRIGRDRLRATLRSRDLPLSDVPGLDSIIGMPMGGRGNLAVQIDLPKNDWRLATGRLAIDCPRCSLGGEGAVFKPKNQTANRNAWANAGWASEGVPVPEIALTSLQAEWVLDKGAILQRRWDFASPHLRVELDFEAELTRSLTDSRIRTGCLRYRGSDELRQLDEKFYNALELTGGPLGPDDLRHLDLAGTLGKFRAFGRFCGPGGGDGDGGAGPVLGGDRPRTRPSLDHVVTPEDETAPTTGVIEPLAEPAAPPADAMPAPRVDDVRPLEPGEGDGAPGSNGRVAPDPPEGFRGRGRVGGDEQGPPAIDYGSAYPTAPPEEPPPESLVPAEGDELQQ